MAANTYHDVGLHLALLLRIRTPQGAGCNLALSRARHTGRVGNRRHPRRLCRPPLSRNKHDPRRVPDTSFSLYELAMAIAAPFLSLFDSGASAEGSIDPLSLASTYDNLANRLLPHLTVRMQRPRFVTAIAVGALVCDSLHDEISADGRTPSWLVFEWHIIEALMRGQQDQQGNDIWGIPGSQKVTRALRFGRRLGADAYLKTPTVFGFTGVYLRLARGLQVVDDGMRLDEGGYVLLREWEQEQGLEGFRTGAAGLGASLRNECTSA